MSASRRRRYDPATMAATETSIWDVYNNAADVRDDELIKDWKDSLHFLLVFAAIFAAVLAALIVESMKMLQQDPQDLTNAILIHLSSQFANQSMAPFAKEDFFEPPHYGVGVNAFLFTSLCCSLIAALAGVIALQWVNEYDAHLESVDARRYALVRHFRYFGVEKWKMGEIIALLPMLLHASVFLFFGGIIVWLKNRHPIIYYICVGGAATAATFYLVTGTLRFSGSAPFRSPAGNAIRYIILYSIYGVSAALVFILVSTLIVLLVVIALPLQILGQGERSRKFAESLWSLLMGRVWSFAFDSFIPSLKTLVSEHDGSNNPSLELEIAIWTATHVGISQQSLHRLVHILGHAHSSLVSDKALPEFWGKALNQIILSYLQDSINRDPSDMELPSIRIFVNIWTAKGHRTWSEEMFVQVRQEPWIDWPPLMKLIGPLDFQGSLTELEMTLVLKLIQITAFKAGRPAMLLLDAVSAALMDNSASLRPHIMRYAISMLSIYLWRREQCDLSQRVSDELIRMVSIPNDRLDAPTLPEMELSLVFSAVYAVAFGIDERPRRFWASKHSFEYSALLSGNIQTVKSLNLALASQFAAAASQEQNNPTVLRKHVRRLCRMLSYTPATETHCDTIIQAAKAYLVDVPHFLDDPFDFWKTDQRSPAALPSLIWISKMDQIDGINHYLALILASRRRCPNLIPMWWDWDWKVDFPSTAPNWLLQLQQDRRLVEVMSAFDDHITSGCSPSEHFTLVSLIIDDLSVNTGGRYNDYYTAKRIGRLMQLQDPALRLVAARAAGIPYMGIFPTVQDPMWSQEAWETAINFWCSQYSDWNTLFDGSRDRGVFIERHSTTRASAISESVGNTQLQNRIREIMRDSLTNGSDDAPPLHIDSCTAPWFHNYLASLSDPAVLRILWLLSSLLPFIDDVDRLERVTILVESSLSQHNEYLDEQLIGSFLNAFENICQNVPIWLQAVKDADIARWVAIAHRMSYIILYSRVQICCSLTNIQRLRGVTAAPQEPARYGSHSSCAATWDM